MWPFWDVAIRPVLAASGARRVVEIGAFRGETTVLVFDALGPEAELHVIDPVPEFDPSEHSARFPGRYLFYRDLSLNVLPDLPPMDVALVDGDHNWYTVYHELERLAATARASGQKLPVMILHDVGWPYARRDLYYAPEQIPEQYRQPYAQRGMRMGRKDLLPRGGLNPTMWNALTEGGPRNGVMTALDDFIAEYERPLRRVVLPIYFGLALVADEERLSATPALCEVFDRLERDVHAAGDLLELSEDVRLNAMLFQHNVFFNRERRLEQASTRYLDLLKGALLGQHSFDNELRIGYLARCIEHGIQPDPNNLRDPLRYLKPEARALEAARRAGRFRQHEGEARDYFPYTVMGRPRLDNLQRCLDTVRSEAVAGDLVECGTGRGGGAMFMRGYLDAHEMQDRTVWVVDPFRASPSPTGTPSYPFGGPGFPELQADLNSVRDGFERFGLLDESVRFLQGAYEATLPDAPIETLAVLRLGEDVGDAAGEILDALYRKITPGGFVIVSGYGIGSQGSVDSFRARHGIEGPLERVDAAGAWWRRTGSDVAPAAVPPRDLTETPARAPLVAPVLAASKDLSVVIVFYNMRREAPRTLQSLSRSYQQNIEDLEYEVIVVENGSDPDQRLGDEWVRSFGPEFRYVDIGPAATPSPVPALNRGIELAAGEALAVMIDGAHVLTPGVLRFGMAGLAMFAPAIVATQQWYVGPGQQGDAMMTGYDEEYEDRLFDEIGWPTDGYRLFDIGHFIGDRDWFDGVWESNCIFLPRKLLEQVGGFDESFTMPGGGFANLEFYERLGCSPDLTVTTIIGEGSFHQVHGGTTTNQVDADERRRRVGSYADHYAAMRGRRFRGPNKTMHYVGSMTDGARRTKARRRTARNLFKGGPDDPDGLPRKPEPIPEELRFEYTDALWRSHAWQTTTWLGQRVPKPASDLVAYQELVSRLRPDWIVETGTGNGGRAHFLASVCDLIGHGRVVSVDVQEMDGRPEHPRITYLTGRPIGDETASRIREIVGDSPNALVVLGSQRSRSHMLIEFDLYAPMVPVGSYVVMENTILNGHPVWPSFGPGPGEAVKTIVNTRSDFAPDPTLERYGVTFSPNGFLKRLR